MSGRHSRYGAHRAAKPSRKATKLQARSSAGKRGRTLHGDTQNSWPSTPAYPAGLTQGLHLETRVVLKNTHADACTPRSRHQRQLMMATGAIASLAPPPRANKPRWDVGCHSRDRGVARRPFSSLETNLTTQETSASQAQLLGMGLGIGLCCGNKHQPTQQQAPPTACTRAARSRTDTSHAPKSKQG